ncbi:MAG TPA: universal stress protein [Spongiibacteraceae bacterium]|jgi:universal stress protein A|nr:universal stress protein [Spongiibacteraceae bacterium]HUH37924.1 universal stress protein [Spongiibacteraceae bacterium]
MYQRLVAAVDLSGNAGAILDAAHRLCVELDGLRVVHVTEAPVTGYGLNMARHRINSDVQAKAVYFPLLKALVEAHGLPHSSIDLRLGRPVEEIRNAAEEHQAELIVIGSHGYGGVRALLGRTANGVLQHARCDVLAVRIVPA